MQEESLHLRAKTTFRLSAKRFECGATSYCLFFLKSRTSDHPHIVYYGVKAAESKRVRTGRVINFRKLAALDIVFLGPKFILAEFSIGVFLPAALGLFTLIRNHSVWQILLGGYLLSLAVNYVPLLLYAIAIVRRRSAREEVAGEVADRDRSFRRYRRQSLFLLIPFAVLILVIAQGRQKGQEPGQS